MCVWQIGKLCKYILHDLSGYFSIHRFTLVWFGLVRSISHNFQEIPTTTNQLVETINENLRFVSHIIRTHTQHRIWFYHVYAFFSLFTLSNSIQFFYLSLWISLEARTISFVFCFYCRTIQSSYKQQQIIHWNHKNNVNSSKIACVDFISQLFAHKNTSLEIESVCVYSVCVRCAHESICVRFIHTASHRIRSHDL